MNAPHLERPIRVLIVEDEADLLEAMVTYLTMDGMQVEGVGSLQAADAWLFANPHDILLLDLGLPDGDGLAWLGPRPWLRDKGVIITTARGDGNQRISGVRSGADQYLVKPVELEELSYAVQNLHRRMHRARSTQWSLNLTNWLLLSPEGRPIKLTHGESILLKCLAESPGLPVSRDALVVQLGYSPLHYDPRRMEIMVRRLRNKTQEILGYHLPFETVHGKGYAFTAAIALLGEVV
jgi:DNA-binding response OmpR family regulator